MGYFILTDTISTAKLSKSLILENSFLSESESRRWWRHFTALLCLGEIFYYVLGFPSGTVVKNPLANVGDTGVSSLGWEDPLKEEMATHSSSLAWKSPWTEEPGRLQSMESQRVGHH